MGKAKTESTKPVVSLAAVTSFIYGGYLFGNRVGEQCVFYLSLADAKALAVWFACIVTGGFIGAIFGLLLNKYCIVKSK